MNQLANVEKHSIIAAIHSGKLGEAVPFRREIFLLDTHIAGCQFQDSIDEISAELHIGDKLTLKREPDNMHDELAILVLDGKGRKMGYVPRMHNTVLARLLDAGKDIYAIFEMERYESHEELSRDVLDNIKIKRENGETEFVKNYYFNFRMKIYMRD
ncbi:MAG: HIRAN domain-containing protein [Ruminiclostridium sp.]